MPAEGKAEYGARAVELVSDRLTAEYGRGFRRSNVFHMIRFAEVFEDPKIVQTLSGQLSWSHFIEIIYLKDPLQRQFYAEMARVEPTIRSKCPKFTNFPNSDSFIFKIYKKYSFLYF